ncbi:hypothetical protein [Streptomyces sp. MUM 178J]|uniref:hypothetical protein n=1 Tax=Streptomyces sp. MUM 178J TaxID=2791991 RepID=UPI001F049306|nr:hypothetical protein [Streptomyces sp. MUM 178J]WRQ80745.1 hypothetical protein I3F59_016035 [Streptomyces sp. MUM 178J]
MLVLPGMGEPRSGINYLWAELARALTGQGIACLRPEMSGCGNDSGVQSPLEWRRQAAAAIAYLRTIANRVIVVARGASALTVPATSDYELVAVRPVGPETVRRLLSAVGIGQPFRPADHVQGGFEVVIEDLGIESRCAGGIEYVPEVLCELELCAHQAPAPAHAWFLDEPTHLTRTQRAELCTRMLNLCV